MNDVHGCAQNVWHLITFADLFRRSAQPPQSSGARGRLPGVSAWYEGRGTPNLFVLGTAAHSRDYRLSAGGFVHGFRYTGELHL